MNDSINIYQVILSILIRYFSSRLFEMMSELQSLALVLYWEILFSLKSFMILSPLQMVGLVVYILHELSWFRFSQIPFGYLYGKWSSGIFFISGGIWERMKGIFLQHRPHCEHGKWVIF